jgi:FeS assembly SUF system protein
MTKMKAVANEEMVKNAVGSDFDELAQPPLCENPDSHPLWPAMRAALGEVYDPEIPVNIYELGLIYAIKIDEENDVRVTMSLTSPGCPVAGEMPGMVQAALLPIDGVGEVMVDIIWDPPWDPSRMAETAKLQLNMFF